MIARRYNTQDCLVAVDLAWPRSDLHTHFKQKNPLDGSGHYIWWGNAAFIAWNKLCNLIWTSSVRLGRFYCGLTKCVYVMDLRAVRCQGNARNVDVSRKVLHTRAFNGKRFLLFHPFKARLCYPKVNCLSVQVHMLAPFCFMIWKIFFWRWY